MSGSAPYDAAVIGLGAMGSMTALELARRGRRVIGFDRHHPPHALGSSHGKSRIIREAYFEHPQYVPIVQRAYEKWATLERESGRTLLIPTGGLMIGRPNGSVVAGARRSAKAHRLPYQMFGPAEVRRRWPMFRLRPDEVALFEPRAGVLLPEACIETALALAAESGAVLRFDEEILLWRDGDRAKDDPGAAPLELVSPVGAYRAARLVLAAGAWMAGPLPQVGLPLAVTRQVLFWFGASGDFGPRAMPVFIWEWEPGRCFYGFPDQGDGVKVAIHHEGQVTTADTVDRTVRAGGATEHGGESAELVEVLGRCAPVLLGSVRESAVCLYANTPDNDFIIDFTPGAPDRPRSPGPAPRDERIVLVSPCSGHGFKFAPAIGEIVADLVDSRPPRFDLSPFRVDRLSPKPAPRS